MDKFVLIIDPQGAIQGTAEKVVGGSTTVFTVPSVSSAKRKLIQTIPELIICMAGIDGDEEAGFKFCSDLKNHPTLLNIPVLILTDKVTEERTALSRSAKALDLVQWPIDADALSRCLQNLVPSLFTSSFKKPEPSAVAASPQPANQTPSSALTGDGTKLSEEKIKLAQQLLAKVLHSLKTSDLLQVIELEDVPRVVYEMTRSVCGIKALDTSKPAEEPKKTEIDLERAFRMKHP